MNDVSDRTARARAGVLVLAPSDGDLGWEVVEVDDERFERVVAASPARHESAASYDTAGQALGAAYDVLTVLTEGRLPPMHEHVQESVKDFVRALEARGYDRQAAVKLLLDMADRQASDPPKRSRKPPSR